MVKNLWSSLRRRNFFTVTYIFLLVFYAFSLFFNLGVAPFYNEEPRRSIIAMEMLHNHNFLVTTLFNDTFYDHPPLWNVVLAVSAKIFGSDTEFAFRFPCALSLLLTGYVVFYMGKKYVGQLFGVISGFLYLVSVDLYFFFSNTAEIDIFFSLLVVVSMLSVFHFYEQKRYTSLFLVAYLFCFLGFLTKGVVALVFLGITLLVFFMYRKDSKIMFLPIHFVAAFLCLGGIVTFFYIYGRFDNMEACIKGMWNITRNKSFLDKENNAFISHFFWFPINMLGNLFPTTLLIFFLFKKSVLVKVKENPYMIFLLLVFASNFLLYWISPGAKARYTYMFYPMLISILTYGFFVSENKNGWVTKLFLGVFPFISFILAIGCLVLPFIDYFKILETLYIFPLLGIATLILFNKQLKCHTIWGRLTLGFITIIMVKFVFSLTVYPLKQKRSSSAIFKNHAKNILEITKDTPIYLYSELGAFGHYEIGKFYITGAYLELMGNRPLKKTSIYGNSGYYILHKEELSDQEVLYTIDGARCCLVLIENPARHSETWKHIPEPTSHQNEAPH